MQIELNFDNSSGQIIDGLTPEHIENWVKQTIQQVATTPQTKPIELSISLVSIAQSQALNQQYRQKDKPTNVLSFVAEQADLPDEVIETLPTLELGDLVICAAVVIQEAEQQNKLVLAHFTHLVVHGVLHLLGYDHETSIEDAEEMEAIEVAILAKLGIANPYEEALCN